MTLQLPKTKSDTEIADALRLAAIDELAPHIPELLTWLQDMNWPVARPVATALSRCGDELVEPIRAVLLSTDDLWKYWLLSSLLHDVRTEIRSALREDLLRIAYSPTPGERAEEADSPRST